MKAHVAQNTRGLTPAELVPKVQVSITALLAHLGQFPTPNPTMVTAQAAVDGLAANLAAIEMQRAVLKQLLETRAQLVASVLEQYTGMVAYVDNVAMGDPVIITLAAMDVAAPPGPAQPMPKVENNTLVSGLDEGTAKGNWKTAVGAKSYEVQVTPDAQTGPWTSYRVVSSAKVELVGQPSGQKRWTRVRAINQVGEGPWSDPSCCMIP